LNLRNVLRTYSLLRALTDDESALLETLRGMNDTERELLVETLVPGKMVTKKAVKKGAGKSQRASGMAETLKKNLDSQRRVAKSPDDNDPNEHCQKEFDGGFVCDEAADANVHHLRGATGYHEFEVGELGVPKIVQVGPSDICSKKGCGLRYDDQAHHQTVRENYHPFDARGFARTVAGKSLTRAGSSTPNSGEETVSAQSAAGGSSE